MIWWHLSDVHLSVKHFTNVTVWRKKNSHRRGICLRGKDFRVNTEKNWRQLGTYGGKKSNYLQNSLQLFQIKLKEQNYFLLLASFLPSIPGNIFAAVSHSFCVWTCGISEYSNSTRQVSKEVSAMPIYAMPWYYKLCFMNLHTSPFQSMPGQATILLVYSAVLPSTSISSDDRYPSKVLGSLIYAVSKCSYLIFGT